MVGWTCRSDWRNKGGAGFWLENFRIAQSEKILGYGLNDEGSIPSRAEFFSSSQRPDKFLGPLDLQSTGYPEFFPRSKAIWSWNPHFYLVLRLRMHGAMLPLTLTSVRLYLVKNQERFYQSLKGNLLVMNLINLVSTDGLVIAVL
jgi:hypothetical protein